MSDKLGDGKFEQAKGGGKADDLNGLGGDLLSKPKATEKAADKVDSGKDQASQAKDSGDKAVAASKPTDVTDAAKEAKMTEAVMGNLNKSVADKVAVLNSSDEGKQLLNQQHGKHGKIGHQFHSHFKHLPPAVQDELVKLGSDT